MLRNIHLFGSISEYFPDNLQLSVNTFVELLTMLKTITPECEEFLRKNEIKAGFGNDQNRENITALNKDTMGMTFGSATDIYITSDVEGEFAAALFATYSFWEAAALFVALVAVSYYLTKIDPPGEQEKTPNNLYNGSFNQSTEGTVVPLVYGRTRTPSVLISASAEKGTVESIIG